MKEKPRPPENKRAGWLVRHAQEVSPAPNNGASPAQAQTGSHLSLSKPKMPSLLTDCVIVGHAEKADVIFTPRQWFAMCAHMMNENPQNFFLMHYIKDGRAKFAKACNARADDRISWAWDGFAVANWKNSSNPAQRLEVGNDPIASS
jgi:hypothetical protein